MVQGTWKYPSAWAAWVVRPSICWRLMRIFLRNILAASYLVFGLALLMSCLPNAEPTPPMNWRPKWVEPRTAAPRVNAVATIAPIAIIVSRDGHVAFLLPLKMSLNKETIYFYFYFYYYHLLFIIYFLLFLVTACCSEPGTLRLSSRFHTVWQHIYLVSYFII